MTYSNFSHPYRVDEATLNSAAGFPGVAQLVQLPQLPDDVRMLNVDPIVFTHAYFLLGQHPQRFVNDLTLYLNGVRPFFERSNAEGGISLPGDANADSRRRLSEDLGVCMAAYFMVSLFGATWESISQIPANTKLSQKRPDFQGFTSNGQRFLMEAKGTTGLKSVEKFLSKAIEQVKRYPEPAAAKIAIVSYLCADKRFFPSMSFVVDPPALPERIQPDLLTSRQLHFEKVLQFVGLADTAKEYMSALSCKLRAKDLSTRGEVQFRVETRLERQMDKLVMHYNEEKKGLNESSFQVGTSKHFIGRHIAQEDASVKVFLGVTEEALTQGLCFNANQYKLETGVSESDGVVTSIFGDGTVLQLSLEH